MDSDLDKDKKPNGEKIKQLRKNASCPVTQAQLAEGCGLSVRTIQRIEAGGQARPYTIHQIAQFFRVSLKEITLDEDKLPDDGWIFPSSSDRRTLEILAEDLRLCETAWLCAIGLNFFWHPEYLHILKERVEQQALHARICMANFQSDEIQRRLREEAREPSGERKSLDVIRQLIDLEKKISDKSRLAIRLFSHAPTYAILMFDRKVHFYMYGFGTRGDHSPTFYVKHVDHVYDFFFNQFELIWDAAIPACDVYSS